MVATGNVTIGTESIALNKHQRYECIRQMAKWGSSVEELFEAEFAREYSDTDELARKKFCASQMSREKKQEIWDSYLVPDQWKQSDFNASCRNFYNVHRREDCEHFAEQWFAKVEFVEANFHRDFFDSWF